MGPTQVLSCFHTIFPEYKENLDIWFPNGKNSIRVRMKNNSEIIFTCNGKDDWSLETVKHFLNSKKGAK